MKYKRINKYNIFNKLLLLTAIVLTIGTTTSVNANIICNDGTVSRSCGTCHQGCCSRHGGCSSGYSGSSGSSSRAASSVKSVAPAIIVKKSSNNKIKWVTIDETKIPLKNSMAYTTTKTKAVMAVALESSKARASYNKNISLKHGNNNQKIVVTAENGSQRIYYVNIKKVNDNANIKEIVIDNQSVSLETMKHETINENINIKVTTEDPLAKATYKNQVTLQNRETELNIIVVAENGNKKEYTVLVKKISTNNNIGEIKINGESVSLEDMKYETSNSTISLEITPEDQYAKAVYDKKIDLNKGDNEIYVTIVAENGAKQNYKLIVNYDDTLDKIATGVFATAMTAGTGTAAAVGIHYSKKRKKKTGQSKEEKKAQSNIGQFCGYCGQKNPNNSSFCGHCGKKINK